MEKESKYYYVAEPGTATYAKLDALAWKRLHAWTAARAFTRKVGTDCEWSGLVALGRLYSKTNRRATLRLG